MTKLTKNTNTLCDELFYSIFLSVVYCVCARMQTLFVFVYKIFIDEQR